MWIVELVVWYEDEIDARAFGQDELSVQDLGIRAINEGDCELEISSDWGSFEIEKEVWSCGWMLKSSRGWLCTSLLRVL